MTRQTSVKIVVLPDPDADTSWLEQPEFEDRLAAYQRDEFGFVGVRAIVEIHDSTSGITTTVQSAGIWGIESDSGDDYFEEVGAEELASIIPELEARHLDVGTIRATHASLRWHA